MFWIRRTKFGAWSKQNADQNSDHRRLCIYQERRKSDHGLRLSRAWKLRPLLIYSNQLRLKYHPNRKRYMRILLFRIWITNSIHIHICEKFWAPSILNLMHIPCAFRRNWYCNRYEYTYMKHALGYWIRIQNKHIYVKHLPGIRNVCIPARMVTYIYLILSFQSYLLELP